MPRLQQLVFASLCVAPSLFAAGVERGGDGDLDIVRIENRFLVAKVAANSGARICSLVTKADGVEQVWWKGGQGAARSGLIDDKAGFETATYATAIEERGPERVVVRFESPGGDGLSIAKRITVVEGEPAIQVDYIYANRSKRPIRTKHMVRNYYLAGGQAGPEDRYFWPGARGPERADFPYGDVGVSHEVMKPWYAVIDTKTRTGLAMVVDSPALLSFYNWADGGPRNPTMEWTVSVDLGPGKSMNVPVTLALLRGLAGVTDATARCVLDLNAKAEENALTVNAQAYPVAALTGDQRIAARFRYETLDRIFLWEEDGIHFGPGEPGQIVEARTVFRTNAPGTHIVSVTARSAGRELNELEMPVIIGHSTGSYFRGKREAEQSRPLVVLTDKDVQRGYVLHWGQPEPPFEPASPVDLTMGCDEYESIELGMLALREMGNVTARVNVPGWPDENIEMRVQEGVAVRGTKLSDGGYALTKGSQLAMPLGAHKAFWVILRSHGVKPGRYSLTVTIHPERGPARALPAVLEVLDVRRDPTASLYLYHTLTYSGTPQHLKILREHYLRQAKPHFGFRTWWRRVSVRRDPEGALVPNFKGLDAALSLPRKRGFDVVHISGALWNDRWFTALNEESPEQQRQTRHEFVRLLVDHLLGLGFKEVVYYAIDEPSIAMATDPEFVARVRELRAAEPRLKIHMTVNHYAPILVRTLNPYIDYWTPNSNVLITLLEDAAKGVVPIDEKDRVGFYGGGWYHTIADHRRADGWRAAYHRVAYYSLFAYSASRREWRLYDKGPDGQPQPTPALEGMRDGFEDFSYWRQFELLLEQAGQVEEAKLSAKSRKVLQNARAFRERAFNMSDDSLVPMRMNRGGHGARPGPTVDAQAVSRWRLLTAKSALLRHMLALKAVLKQSAE